MVSSVSTRRFWIYRHRVFWFLVFILRGYRCLEGGGGKKGERSPTIYGQCNIFEKLNMTKRGWGEYKVTWTRGEKGLKKTRIWKGEEWDITKRRRWKRAKNVDFHSKIQTKTVKPRKDITKKTTTEFKKDSDARVGRWILLSRELGPPTFRDSTIIFF